MDAGTPMTPEIVGRDAELRILDQLLDAAIDGRASTLLIMGEAGIGKSRLALAAAERASARSARVVTGGSVAIGGEPLRHVALIEILDRLGDGNAGPGRTTDEMLEVTLAALKRAASAGPLLVILEDLHWADTGTCQVVMALSRFVRRLPVLIVATARDDELADADPRSQFLAELGRSELVTVLRLARLERPGIVRQIELLLGPDASPDVVATIVERSGGNPLLIEELSAVDHVGAPHALLDVLSSRFHRLSQPARDVVAALAVAGRPVGDDALAQVADRTTDVVRANLAEAVDAHVLEVGPQGLAFRHIVLADAVRDELVPDHRARLHRAWATTLAAELDANDPADPAELAVISHHWLQGGEAPSALAASWRAGNVAETVVAPDIAHSQYRRVLDLWDRVPDAAARTGSSFVEVVVRAAEVANRCGQPNSAVEITRAALTAADLDGATTAILYERTGWYLLRAGEVDEARDAYREAVDRAARDAPPDLRARVVAGSVRIWERLGDHERAVSVAGDALATAVDTGDPVAIAQARYMLGHSLMLSGDLDAAEEELLAAAQGAEDNLDPAMLGWAHLAIATCAGRRGRLLDAVDGALASSARLRAAGQSDPFGAIVASVAGALLLRLGDEGRARRLGEEVVSETQSSLGKGLGRLLVGLCDVECMQLSSARRLLDEARDALGPLYDGRILGMLTLGRVDLVLAEGTPELAAAIVRDGVTRIENTGDHEMLVHLAVAGLRAEADVARHRIASSDAPIDPEGAARVEFYAGIVDRVAADSSQAWPDLVGATATVAGERAMLAREPDRSSWQRAAAAWEEAQWPRLAIYARLREGEVLVAHRWPREAQEALRDALAAGIALGSPFLETRVRHVAVRGQVDLGDVGDAEVPSDPTPREVEVLELLAGGATNQKIGAELEVSEKAVGALVASILTKLHVADTREAVRAARHRGFIAER